MKFRTLALAAALVAAGTSLAWAQAKEQFFPVLVYRTGAYAPNGVPFANGYVDYLKYVNAKGGINGVKITFEECETGYATDKGVECYERLKGKGGGATVFQPLSTGITFALTEKAPGDKIPLITFGYGRTDATDGRVFPWVFPLMSNYWDAATGIVRFIRDKEGGSDASLKGKKIVLLYHDSAYGKEPHAVMEAEAKKLGFEFKMIPVPHPGNEQQSQWLQIRQYRPDWVVLWGWGVMTATSLQTAQKVGFPREKIVGNWWAGSEIDTEAAGPAATGYYAASLNLGGKGFPVVQEIEKVVYGKGKGNGNPKLIGTVLWNRGVAAGMFTVEAVRKAQEKFGKKPVSGEQVRWGIENLDINAGRLKSLGFNTMLPPIKVTCQDHGGSGQVRFQQWSGTEWKAVSDWMKGDAAMVRKMIEDSAAKYAAEKGFKPACL